MQELRLWEIVLLAVWMLGCAVWRAVDQMVNALYALLVQSVMVGEGMGAGDVGEEGGDIRDEDGREARAPREAMGRHVEQLERESCDWRWGQ
jgi:hypothetical protein